MPPPSGNSTKKKKKGGDRENDDKEKGDEDNIGLIEQIKHNPRSIFMHEINGIPCIFQKINVIELIVL